MTALETAMESGEIGPIDAEVTAYALMGLGELVGMRWILWGDGEPDARRVSPTSSRGSSAASSRPRSEAGRPACDRFVPAGAVDDRCGDCGALRHPGAGDRGEVRAARQAHRRRRRARERPLGQGDRAPARRDRLRSEGRSTSSCTTARCGATTPSGRRRRTSPIASARRTRSRSSTTTSRTARRSRCVSRATCCAPSRSSRTSSSSPRAASRTSSTTTNEKSRFMFNFGDGAVAGLLVGDAERNEVLGVARDHERCVLAAGEGRRRRLGRSRRLPLPRRPGPGGDEGRARPGVAAELRRRRTRRGRALRAHARRPRLRLPAAHEALDVRGVAVRARNDAKIRPSTSTTPAT